MASDAAKQKQGEAMIMKFQSLRNEQRSLANTINTLEMDLKEHRTVIETLKAIDENRKCFRLIGGVLCERTVKDVLPQLIENKTNLEKSIETTMEKLTKKGEEINKFKEENKIKIHSQEMFRNLNQVKPDETKETTDDDKGNRNVLVSD